MWLMGPGPIRLFLWDFIRSQIQWWEFIEPCLLLSLHLDYLNENSVGRGQCSLSWAQWRGYHSLVGSRHIHVIVSIHSFSHTSQHRPCYRKRGGTPFPFLSLSGLMMSNRKMLCWNLRHQWLVPVPCSLRKHIPRLLNVRLNTTKIAIPLKRRCYSCVNVYFSLRSEIRFRW